MRDEWVRTARTVIGVTISVAAVIPLAVPALGLSSTVGAGAVLIGVAAAATRLMAIPAISEPINRWLRAE